ncbi:hypothetical protein FE257_006772 [Aspergillus nanangensis]|uniref:Calponin-homology (CH) domain-containing protein n=1 Tax=Aspergillus nanangensis TaxID=2582783 RepID=A0AAD4GUQ0_ASPNN|nr:hypothetical protein FE257_006772 [Aspergillus nanangensis]
MSGLLEDVGTPCPSRFGSSRLEQSRTNSDTFSTMWEDSLSNCENTLNVDFTTEIKAPTLTGTKPRRKPKTNTTFLIHDDVGEKPAQTTIKRRRETNTTSVTSNRKKSLLAQPAQKFRPKVSFAPSPISNVSRYHGDPEKRQSTKLDAEENKELLMQINGTERDLKPKDLLKKDVRRNTVYIPPDDTTVASVFMGIFSPLKLNTSNHQTGEDTQINSLESQIAKKRQAKQSLAASAHRVPLQPSSKVKQEPSIHVDVVGKNGGKENIPPGTLSIGGKDKVYQPMKILSDNVRSIPNSPETKPRTSKPLAAKNGNGSLQRAMRECQNNAKARSAGVDSRKNYTTRGTGPVNAAASRSTLRSSNVSRSLTRSKPEATLARSAISQKSTRVLDEYPIIPETITNTTLYEDNWLSHQEVVITQLLNDMLYHSDGDTPFYDSTILRHELLSISQDAAFTHLYKRVKASLLYGAMGIPKDILARNKRLKQDVGMKRRFLDFWLETYDLRALRAAVETIAGRIIPNSGSQDESIYHPSESNSTKERALKRKLEKFLETFLLQNQDMDLSRDHHDGDTDAAGQAYRRTVLRCIMTIILLDKGQMSSAATMPRLFTPTSQFKSSAAVLKGLARFLLPSCGDIIKALAHLDCQLVYEQHPLHEYTFSLSNLAVDLRDGVRLTRVVELLLFADNGPRGLLSQRLKIPCLGRAVKLFNVQIALDALASTPKSRKLVSHIRAEDIVDGHREKTIALLWGLVSNAGLSGLLDWGDVRKEIDRLKEKAIGQFGYEHVKDESRFHGTGVGVIEGEDDMPITLLTQWVSILAQLKGLHLENLSTSFGDGKIYESIVDEYENYIIGTDLKTISNPNPQPIPSLQTRLRALGCSTQFANLVAPSTHKSHTLDSEFTVGALAFLCSRFLSATKRARAAIVLQKTWRRILDCRNTRLREMARDVAIQCAAVVQTRDRLLWAKGVIIQWWRASKVKRHRRKIKAGRRHETSKIAVRREPLRAPSHRY